MQVNKKKEINVLKNLNMYNGLKSSVIIPYTVILMPIIQVILFAIVYLFTSKSISYIGHMNTAMFIFLPLFVSVFLFVDLYKLFFIKKTSLKNWVINYPEIVLLFFTFLWMCIACFFHNCNDFALYADSETGKTMQECMLFFIYYAVVFAISFTLKDKKIIKNIIIAFLFVSIFCGIIACVDPFCTSLLTKATCNWSGLFINSNHYAYLICMFVVCSMCIFFNTNKVWLKIFTAIVFVFNSVVSFFNNTLGSMLAILVVLMLFPVIQSVYNKKFSFKYFVPIIIYIGISFAVLPFIQYVGSNYTSLLGQLTNLFKELVGVAKDPMTDESMLAGTSRWELWVNSVKNIVKNPIFGDGKYIVKPHNEYLQIAEHSGLPATIFYISSLIILLVKTLKYLKFLSKTTFCMLLTTLVYLICAFFGNTMPHTTPFFMVILAFSIRLLNNDIKDTQQCYEQKEIIKE